MSSPFLETLSVSNDALLALLIRSDGFGDQEVRVCPRCAVRRTLDNLEAFRILVNFLLQLVCSLCLILCQPKLSGLFQFSLDESSVLHCVELNIDFC